MAEIDVAQSRSSGHPSQVCRQACCRRSGGCLSAGAAAELVVPQAAGVLAGHELGQAEGVVPRVGAGADRAAHRLQPCSRRRTLSDAALECFGILQIDATPRKRPAS